jgi:hypothetical protein
VLALNALSLSLQSRHGRVVSLGWCYQTPTGDQDPDRSMQGGNSVLVAGRRSSLSQPSRDNRCTLLMIGVVYAREIHNSIETGREISRRGQAGSPAGYQRALSLCCRKVATRSVRLGECYQTLSTETSDSDRLNARGKPSTGGSLYSSQVTQLSKARYHDRYGLPRIHNRTIEIGREISRTSGKLSVGANVTVSLCCCKPRHGSGGHSLVSAIRRFNRDHDPDVQCKGETSTGGSPAFSAAVAIKVRMVTKIGVVSTNTQHRTIEIGREISSGRGSPVLTNALSLCCWVAATSVGGRWAS